jgi:hypothetical protein
MIMKDVLDVSVNGFMLGLSTGLFCLTSCLPVILSVNLSREDGAHGTWAFLGKFLGGRFLAYLGLGLLTALAGNTLGALSQSIGVYGLMVLSLILISYGLGLKLPRLEWCRMARGGRFFPFVLGGLSGLNICPPLLLAFAYGLQRGMSPAVGVVYFVSFFAATTLYIIPVGIVGYLPRHRIMANMGRIASVVVGAIFFYRGAAILAIL